uniref:CCHC-type domain-containing protein n=1 Tax=Globodera rostochiensis TaxID=31243 RepID=A0A914I8S6_GLORO
MQHIKIEFDTTETRKNPSSDHEEYDGSSSSTSNESKVQNGDCGHHSPTPSVKQKSSPAELSDNAIAQTKTFRRRTAFETSEAMREIFGASPFSSQQKENLGEINRKTTTENQQNNKREIRLSELEDDVENRDFDHLSEVEGMSVPDGVAQIMNERPILENGVTKMNNRRRSDNRILPAISGSWERASRPAVVNWHKSAGPSSVGWRSAANPPGAAVCWYCGVKGHVAVHCRKMRRKGQ